MDNKGAYDERDSNVTEMIKMMMMIMMIKLKLMGVARLARKAMPVSNYLETVNK